MSTALHPLLPSVCLLTVACSGGPNFPLRNGPEFEEAFPDPTVLVVTDDVNEVRSLLATVPLPDTDEHHEQLIALLGETTELGAEHLLLLTEAVNLEAGSKSYTVATTSNGNQVFYWSRGDGEYADIVDELLLTGVRKVRDPSPSHFGRLLSRTQNSHSLVALVNECAGLANASEWDDGSDGALKEILSAAAVDQVRIELCVDALLPAGRLSDSRADIALASLSFDSSRVDLLAADYDRRPSISADALLRHVRLMSFDDARMKAVELGSPLLKDVEGHAFLQLVETASFDSGRIAIVKELAERANFSDSSQALAVVRSASFDNGRERILDALAEGPFVKLNGDDLVAFAQTASFDSGRGAILDILKRHVSTPLKVDDLRRLLETVSFDSGRQHIVETFVDEIRRIPASDRHVILDTFSFDSARDKARSTLDW